MTAPSFHQQYLALILIVSLSTITGTGSVLPGMASYDAELVLYSWRNPAGIWEYSLLNHPDIFHSPKEIMSASNKIRGFHELAIRMTHLPKNTDIVWRSLPLGQIDYPPEKIISQVKELAVKEKLSLEIMPTLSE